MKRLIEKGLMFGNLLPVDSPALVERYRRALQHLTGRDTELNDFHVDISGYSPEIGAELNDHLYLNPNGCNRQFILLTTEQKTAPLLNAKFSFSRGVLRKFIDVNEAEIFALTTRDAVAGELVNSVFDLPTADRLFAIRRIAVEADTTAGDVSTARELTGRIERFKTEEDAWWDDVLIAEMIELASNTGDVTRNPIDLKQVTVEAGSFWTGHFGGIYLFRDVDHPTMVSSDPVPANMPIENVCGLGDRRKVAKFLDRNRLAEPITRAGNANVAAILKQKMDFILVDVAAAQGYDISGATRRDLRQVARSLASSVPEEFHGLADLLRWFEGGGDRPRIRPDHPAYFYTIRSGQHEHRELVNQMLAELAPLDVLQLFICHKSLFYRLYGTWPEAKKRYVADFLANEYLVDKAGQRDALFGLGQGIGKHGPDGTADPEHMLHLVGPWGAVRER